MDDVLVGECIEIMNRLPAESIDMIFADPPYFLQLGQDLLRPDNSAVDGVDEDWDKFDDLAAYDRFTGEWLKAAHRLLRPDGTIWVIGSYHNIFRVGARLQDLGFWILNDVIWRKTNPMPNFRGRRFTNAHETLIWCAKEQGARNLFNYDAMKAMNGGVQMRSDWYLPVCTGTERVKGPDGKKLHPTQKPESLLHRVILASTKPGGLILDPFFRHRAQPGRSPGAWAATSSASSGIRNTRRRRGNASRRSSPCADPEMVTTPSRREQPRVPFGSLVERGLVRAGDVVFDARRRWSARVRADGTLIAEEAKGSIHAVGAAVQGAPACNGWTFWHIEREGRAVPLDSLRERIRAEMTGL